MPSLLVRHEVADCDEWKRVFVVSSADVPEAQSSSGVVDVPDIYFLESTWACPTSRVPSARARCSRSPAATCPSGAAGSAVQCMNLMLGLEETDGLNAIGLHPR